MKQFRVMMEEERLHIVVDGYSAEDLTELLKLLGDFATKGKNGEKVAKVTKIDDFEKATPQEPAEIPEPKKPASTTEKVSDDAAKKLYEKYYGGMKEGNESFIAKAFKADGGEMNALNPEQKKAFAKAFKVWFKERYSDDPFKNDLKSQKGFLKLYEKYIAEEVKSLEEQMGMESGSFLKVADPDQITIAYESCREAMLKRSESK